MSINQLPTEIFVLIAAFFAKDRDLIDATAVCRHWRTILLSSSQLWCNVGGSLLKIQAYLERSGPMPLVVNLSCPELTELIVPHTSRLVSLALRVADPRSSFSQILGHLRHPIPTLHTLHISGGTRELIHTVEFASDVCDAFFAHSKKLELDGIHLFRGPPVVPDSFKPFPRVTEIVFRASQVKIQIADLLDTLGRLPTLERASITLGSFWHLGNPQTITLPHVQEITVQFPARGSAIPPIFGLIKLPNLTSLRLQGIASSAGICNPIFPAEPFGEYLPNLANLPELQVSVNTTSIEFAFRNPQAVFSCVTHRAFQFFRDPEVIWGTLPLHTVRRLVVDVWDPSGGVGDEWFVELLRDLVNLEHLEFGGECPDVVQLLCRFAMWGELPVPIQTLVERVIGEE